MAKSEEINELATALAKAQGSITHAIKDSVNPFHKSSYADLASVWDACRKQLSENGLSITQLPDGLEDNCLILDTTMLHSSGQWISSKIKMPLSKTDPQGYGSTLTYARRYALASIVGVYQDDNDCEDGMKRNDSKQQNKPANTNTPAQQNKPATQANNVPELITPPQLTKLQVNAKEQNLTSEDMKGILLHKYKLDSSKKLTKVQASWLIENLQVAWNGYVESQIKNNEGGN